jgi:hypothetical protein
MDKAKENLCELLNNKIKIQIIEKDKYNTYSHIIFIYGKYSCSIAIDNNIELNIINEINFANSIGFFITENYKKKIINECNVLNKSSKKYTNTNIEYKIIKNDFIKNDIIKNELIKTYIIKDCNNGFYKIGKSKNPAYREKTLQSEKPNIKIVKIFNSDIEKILHNTYNKQRIRGEWFSLNNIQLKHICNLYN